MTGKASSFSYGEYSKHDDCYFIRTKNKKR